jgi:RND superfamily putative drug exporter
VSAAYTGATAIAAETVDDIQHDLFYVLLAAFLVNLVLLMVFLRSLVAPFLLVGASALGLAATIGLTTLVFQGLLGYSSLTYYVPIAVSVLLISFGSDYNVFIVGRIYQESRERPLREAIGVAVPEASRAVTVAGVTLAGSFATLALIPLSSFREFAFAMCVGVLLDTFVVRSLLIPAVISAVGERCWWPGSRTARRAG